MIEEDEYLETLDESVAEIDDAFASGARQRVCPQSSDSLASVPPQVQSMYVQLGRALRTYRGGKLPKAIMLLATERKIKNWLDLLLLMEPRSWSLDALLGVTHIFQHHGSVKRNTIYNERVLLEYTLDLVESDKKISKNMFEAFLIAGRTPQAFLVGFLIPFAQESDCSRKTAKFIGELMERVKISNTYANVFVEHLVKLEKSNVITLFISKVISRSFALTISSIDGIFAYFLSFQGEYEKMNLLWNKALLEFVQKYGKNLLSEQREEILELIQDNKEQETAKRTIDLLHQLSASSQ